MKLKPNTPRTSLVQYRQMLSILTQSRLVAQRSNNPKK